MSDLEKTLEKFQAHLVQAIDDKFRLNNDLLLQEIRASESRTNHQIKSLEENMGHKFESLKDELLTGVGEMLDGQVIPQIDDHEVRLTRLETKTA